MNARKTVLIAAALVLSTLAAASCFSHGPAAPRAAAPASAEPEARAGAFEAGASRAGGSAAELRHSAPRSAAARREVEEAGRGVVALVEAPAAWTAARLEETRGRFADMTTASLLNLLRVRAAGARAGDASLRELQEGLALRVAEDPQAGDEVTRAVEAGRVGRAGAAWARGALLAAR